MSIRIESTCRLGSMLRNGITSVEVRDGDGKLIAKRTRAGAPT